MTIINTNTTNNIVPETTSTVEKTETLGQEAFLELMIAQLKNQDPLSPQGNGEFLAQLAQFSTVEGITSMSDSLEAMVASVNSSQILQSSSMVGKSVLVPGNNFRYNGMENFAGAVDLPQSTDSLKINITDEQGLLIRQIDLQAQGQGVVNFTWDGKDNTGQMVSPGDFTASAETGTDDALEMLISTKVNAVIVSNNSSDINLKLENNNSVNINEVREIS